MVNGTDGVWSYDGLGRHAAPVVVTKIDATNPAQISVAGADLPKFSSADGDDQRHRPGRSPPTACTIGSVGAPAGTFTLKVSTSCQARHRPRARCAPALWLDDEGGRPRTGRAPSRATRQTSTSSSHINRLYFADPSNLAVYYLPLQSKGGPVSNVPADDRACSRCCR
jgi:hypothetical protein